MAGLFDQSLKLKAKWKIKTKADRGGDVVIDRIVRAARELVEDQGLRMADIRAIGLGVPGVVIKGRVFNAYNLHWDEVAIQSILRMIENAGRAGIRGLNYNFLVSNRTTVLPPPASPV